MKKFLKVMSVACVAALCFVLMGCGANQVAEEANTASDNRAYMSSLNTSMDELSKELDTFNEAVAKSDLVSMRTSAQKVSQVIEDIRGYQVPDTLKDVSSKYLEGLDSLNSSLGAYVSLFEGIENGKTSNTSSALAQIQTEYDKGIAALQEADKMATELK